ncbi:hypothetical protein CWE08_11930 [Aliidiomarina iranensis]|uniref:Fido domain-containing protein n=1 Tax=Aliidiomarina iranensis TaxID=1434071 RepID=A0A432VPL0_9GAMM|nr:virulence protein RhuM/Fic/DOC family protein [Aliidiomarina iranensis]RUO18102.1 hypothetical protein CWE08_11930 [Aliidiomarina iranensis]
MTNNIEIYQTDDGQVQLQLRLEQESLWLTQVQMAELFETSSDNISLHLKNIYQEQELQELATTEDFSVVRQEGKRQVQRQIKHYNLDAIISVGYRVSSTRATQFRIWATNTLKQYLIEGYTLNQLRLQERGVEFEQAIALLSRTLAHQQLVSDEGEAVLAVINDYAHLLYFVIKNHPLADGNKRTGSFLFLWYLRVNQHLLAKPVEQLINDNTLVALAHLVAESLPDQKELMIHLVEHFILMKAEIGGTNAI